MASNEQDRQWYVLRVISGKENKVKEMVEAACKNTDYGKSISQVLVPTEKVYTTRGGKKVLKDRILFSGYLFVQASLEDGVEEFLRNTTNVVDFVRSRDTLRKPEPIRESDMARMLGNMESAVGPDGEGDFTIGENVKVVDGPFNGFIGEIEEVNREKRKLRVMVKVFGRKTPLELDNSQVERE